MSRVKHWLRWLAVLPGALAGGILMTFPLHWILYNTLTEFIEPYPQLPERILTPFIIAVGFVAIGARIAPARKSEVALVLFGLWMTFLGGTAAVVLFVGHIGRRQFFFHGGGLASAGAFVGGVVGFLIARKQAAAVVASSPISMDLADEEEAEEAAAQHGGVPQIGREIAWSDIVRQVFRVRQFDRAGTTIDENGAVHATSASEPYGYLLVDSPIVRQPLALPIVHRDDFLLAASVFDDPKFAEAVTREELLVTYAPKQLLPKGLAGGTTHALHYVITPRGTLQRYYESEGNDHRANPAPEKLFGRFVYEGSGRVQVNPEPQL